MCVSVCVSVCGVCVCARFVNWGRSLLLGVISLLLKEMNVPEGRRAVTGTHDCRAERETEREREKDRREGEREREKVRVRR